MSACFLVAMCVLLVFVGTYICYHGRNMYTRLTVFAVLCLTRANGCCEQAVTVLFCDHAITIVLQLLQQFGLMTEPYK